MTTSVDIANRALAEAGTRSQLTGVTIDPTQSAEALYCSLLYGPLRDFLLREGDYDWSTQSTGAVLSPGGFTNPWTLGYAYPSGALRIRQLIPTSFAANNPVPVEWDVISASGVRKIVTRTAITSVWYTASQVEDLWDAIFTESFVRLLAAGLIFALENRIEASDIRLKEAISFAGIANLRDS